MEAGKGHHCSSRNGFHQGPLPPAPYHARVHSATGAAVPNNLLPPRFPTPSSNNAALQSIWIQRLKPLNSIEDSSHRPHSTVWTHFTKDFSSCRRHTNASIVWSGPFDDKKLDTQRSQLAVPCQRNEFCHQSHRKDSFLSSDNYACQVPSNEDICSTGASSGTLELSLQKGHSKAHPVLPLEAVVPSCNHRNEVRCFKADQTQEDPYKMVSQGAPHPSQCLHHHDEEHVGAVGSFESQEGSNSPCLGHHHENIIGGVGGSSGLQQNSNVPPEVNFGKMAVLNGISSCDSGEMNEVGSNFSFVGSACKGAATGGASADADDRVVTNLVDFVVGSVSGVDAKAHKPYNVRVQDRLHTTETAADEKVGACIAVARGASLDTDVENRVCISKVLLKEGTKACSTRREGIKGCESCHVGVQHLQDCPKMFSSTHKLTLYPKERSTVGQKDKNSSPGAQKKHISEVTVSREASDRRDFNVCEHSEDRLQDTCPERTTFRTPKGNQKDFLCNYVIDIIHGRQAKALSSAEEITRGFSDSCRGDFLRNFVIDRVCRRDVEGACNLEIAPLVKASRVKTPDLLRGRNESCRKEKEISRLLGQDTTARSDILEAGMQHSGIECTHPLESSSVMAHKEFSGSALSWRNISCHSQVGPVTLKHHGKLNLNSSEAVKVEQTWFKPSNSGGGLAKDLVG